MATKKRPKPRRRCGSPTGKSRVQSVVFDRDEWTPREARSWLADHGKKAPQVDRTPNQLRYRQVNPDRGCAYRTQRLGSSGVSLVLEFPPRARRTRAVQEALVERRARR